MTRSQKILLICTGVLIYAAFGAIYLLSISGRIAVLPGAMHALAVEDQAVAEAINVRRASISDSRGGYIVFTPLKPYDDSPKFASVHLEEGSHEDVSVPIPKNDPLYEEMFTPGTVLRATLYSHADGTKFNLPNWRFPMRNVFGEVVTDTFVLR